MGQGCSSQSSLSSSSPLSSSSSAIPFMFSSPSVLLSSTLQKQARDYYYDSYNKKVNGQALMDTMLKNDCRSIISAVQSAKKRKKVDFLMHAFHSAASNNHTDLLQLFLDNGMDIDIKNLDGFTALLLAFNSRDEKTLRVLLQHHPCANPDIQDDDGKTALIHACSMNSFNIVLLLLEKCPNLDLNMQDNEKMTAMMKACQRGNFQIVELLLNHGADVELRNQMGWTALDMACSLQIKELLRNHMNTSYVLK